VLGARLDVGPAEVRFTTGERGRLELRDGLGDGLSFNLSHAGGWVLVATSWRAPVGADIEPIRPLPHLLDVARRVLRPEACDQIERAAPDQRGARFFAEWVRHEARLKCRGTGIVEPADDDGRADDLTIVDLAVSDRCAAAIAVACVDATIEIVTAPGARTRVA
jgi:4'-phosphopantetheinyl transferase